ncbi:acyl-protein synthetase [uncultured Paraglaciecola sp.]|uniref:LuxE/PaaK family acyltransferase n=1 Tax=uncultured Paraglaciecola sp. TaxID=1765024 RepID=UPI002634FAD8|nr:acyl-protein synthetase [uncultured Paraglaciecola sp.]
MNIVTDGSAYSFCAEKKKIFLRSELLALTELHAKHCSPYANLLKQFTHQEILSIEDIPPLSVRLFKELELKSIAEREVFKTLYSSGTNGQPSKIFLDKATAQLQSQVLVKILQDWLGKARRPMLLIDSPTTVKKSNAMTARAAGLQGLSFFGRDHTYALDENMQLNLPVVEAFFSQYAEQPILIFGFTFMVWQQFIQALAAANIQFNCRDGTLIHGGGWKKLQDQAVSNAVFKQAICQQLGQVSVHDYYGMVEQTGTIYMECEQGHLHCPIWSDVLIRDPADLSLCPHNQVGLIQVNSILARSYPGHCLLTEDLGEILGEDNCPCGRLGKYFKVHGRVPKAEVRGCSDTFS